MGGWWVPLFSCGRMTVKPQQNVPPLLLASVSYLCIHAAAAAPPVQATGKVFDSVDLFLPDIRYHTQARPLPGYHADP